MPFREGPRQAQHDEDGNPTFSCTWQGMSFRTRCKSLRWIQVSTYVDRADHQGCDKTFGTAQHARRHEKSREF
jgi:hypothetical protein